MKITNEEILKQINDYRQEKRHGPLSYTELQEIFAAQGVRLTRAALHARIHSLIDQGLLYGHVRRKRLQMPTLELTEEGRKLIGGNHDCQNCTGDCHCQTIEN